MIAFRIAKNNRILDVTGLGAKLAGGRWNLKGFPVIYASASLSMALSEFGTRSVLSAKVLKLLKYREINIPSGIKVSKISIKSLKKGWRNYPYSQQCLDVGMDWLVGQKSCVLQVPSALIPDEWNVLFNPLHSDFSRIVFKAPKNLDLNDRLIRKLEN